MFARAGCRWPRMAMSPPPAPPPHSNISLKRCRSLSSRPAWHQAKRVQLGLRLLAPCSTPALQKVGTRTCRVSQATRSATQAASQHTSWKYNGHLIGGGPSLGLFALDNKPGKSFGPRGAPPLQAGISSVARQHAENQMPIQTGAESPPPPGPPLKKHTHAHCESRVPQQPRRRRRRAKPP